MSGRPPTEAERNQEATVYIGNLDEQVTDALVKTNHEFMLFKQ